MPRGPLKKCHSCYIASKKCHRSHLVKVPTARPLLESLLYREYFIEQVEQNEEFVGIFRKYHEGRVSLVELLELLEERRLRQPLFGKRGIRILAHRRRTKIAIEMYGVKHEGLNDTKI